jgi:hypothetical protein
MPRSVGSEFLDLPTWIGCTSRSVTRPRLGAVAMPYAGRRSCYSQAVVTVIVTETWASFGKYRTVHGSEVVLGLLALPLLHP